MCCSQVAALAGKKYRPTAKTTMIRFIEELCRSLRMAAYRKPKQVRCCVCVYVQYCVALRCALCVRGRGCCDSCACCGVGVSRRLMPSPPLSLFLPLAPCSFLTWYLFAALQTAELVSVLLQFAQSSIAAVKYLCTINAVTDLVALYMANRTAGALRYRICRVCCFVVVCVFRCFGLRWWVTLGTHNARLLNVSLKALRTDRHALSSPSFAPFFLSSLAHSSSSSHSLRYTHTHTHTRKHRQTARQPASQPARQIDRERQTDRHRHRQTDRQTDRQRDRQTDRQTDRHTHTHTHTHTLTQLLFVSRCSVLA